MGLFNSATFAGPDVGSGAPVRKRKIGIALGAGAARGWAHIGVLRTLEAAGIKADVIAGASAGSVIAGCYAAGKLKNLEDFARSLTRRRVFSLMDLTFSGAGLVAGGRLRDRLEEALSGVRFEDLPLEFVAVATEMGTGHEIWLNKGLLTNAICASYALPGIFEPVKINGRWLFDGACVNPIPVSVCRASEAEYVIAVNVNSELRRSPESLAAISEDSLPDETAQEAVDQSDAPQYGISLGGFLPTLRGRYNMIRQQCAAGTDGPPGIATAMIDAFNITQDRIARSRLAGDPPDIAINLKMGHIGIFDFHRAAEMIDIGREAARRMLPEIQELLNPAR